MGSWSSGKKSSLSRTTRIQNALGVPKCDPRVKPAPAPKPSGNHGNSK